MYSKIRFWKRPKLQRGGGGSERLGQCPKFSGFLILERFLYLRTINKDSRVKTNFLIIVYNHLSMIPQLQHPQSKIEIYHLASSPLNTPDNQIINRPDLQNQHILQSVPLHVPWHKHKDQVLAPAPFYSIRANLYNYILIYISHYIVMASAGWPATHNTVLGTATMVSWSGGN